MYYQQYKLYFLNFKLLFFLCMISNNIGLNAQFNIVVTCNCIDK